MSDKSSIKIAVLSQLTSRGYFELYALDSSDDFHLLASNIGTAALKRPREPDTFLGGGGHRTFARHLKLAGACRNFYDFHQSRNKLFMSAQSHPPTHTHTKHYIRLRNAQDCGRMSKERLPFVSIFRILRRRGCRTDASRADPTSGHSHESHPGPKPDHLTAEAVFVLTSSSFNSIHILTSFNPHHERTFLTDLQQFIQIVPRMRSSS